MPALSITKTYLNGNILTQTDLDNICNSVTTFLNTTKIDNTNIQAGAILGSNIANATITQSNLGAQSVGQAQLASSAVGQNQLAPQAVAQNNIASSAVGAIQRAPLNYFNSIVISVSGGSQGNLLGTPISITTSGRPIWIGLKSSGANGLGVWGVTGGTTTVLSYLQIQNVTMSSTAGYFGLVTSNSATQLLVPCSSVWTVDFQPAGSYAYQLACTGLIPSNGLTLTNCSLFAYEL